MIIKNISILSIKPSGSLFAFVSITVDLDGGEIALDSIGIYSRPEGEIALSFPTRKLKSGQNIPYFSFSETLKEELLEAVKKELEESGILSN